MKDYHPDYTQCQDSRKEIHGNICKHCIKNTVMLCNLHNSQICSGWIGYIHEGYVDNAKLPK